MITSLKALNILAVDCQTTGATPEKGRLLEIGWVKTDASGNQYPDRRKAIAYLFKLPDPAALSRPVERITGITCEDLTQGLPPGDIRQRLVWVAERVMAANRSDRCPLVIHFSRFEEPFLRELFIRSHSRKRFIFQIICTHEIVRRLLPNLPRKGLRAVAGYFGYALPEQKRSAGHALATAFIWQQLVSLLTRKEGIHTMAQLKKWLRTATPVKSRKRIYPMDAGDMGRIPDQPGIYRMLRANAQVLYIGKATSLKKRVSSYFRPRGASSEHILEMLTQAHNLDFTPTASALEAALLETDEIKRLSPPYNVALRRRQRRLVFASRDLQRFALTADRHHPIGPLPSNRLNHAMTAFAILIKKNVPTVTFEQAADAVLAVTDEYAPDKDCLHEGIHLFRKRYRHVLGKGRHPLRCLTGLGARFWREHLQNTSLGQNELERTDNEEKPYVENGPEGWDPERVARTIERVIQRSAHLVRRARWFCLLSESSLTWTSPRAGDGRKFLLMFQKGTLVTRKSLGIKTSVPIPSGCHRPTLQRKQPMDIITYDRLRVLTTELRRLDADKREIELRLGPTARLGRRQVSRALDWV